MSASTIVDLPEPMSPVSSAVSPPGVNRQTWLSNVPQLQHLDVLQPVAGPSGIPEFDCGRRVLSLIAGHRSGVFAQLRREVRQGLGVDVGL